MDRDLATARAGSSSCRRLPGKELKNSCSSALASVILEFNIVLGA